MNDLFSQAKYTIDTCSLNDLFQDGRVYNKKQFVSLWDKFNATCKMGLVISHIEVFNEIVNGNNKEEIKWARSNKYIFEEYDVPKETDFIKQMGANKKLINFILQDKQKSVHADPWLIAQAKINNLTIITEEKKDSPKKIPQIAALFEIESINILGLIEKMDWHF